MGCGVRFEHMNGGAAGVAGGEAAPQPAAAAEGKELVPVFFTRNGKEVGRVSNCAKKPLSTR